MSVLIVEDNPMILKALSYTFKHVSSEVYAAIDGMQAKEFYQKYRPSLVIADLMLPFVTGLELVEFIRETELNYTKIIVLTAMDTEDSISQAFELGVDDYMVKPFMSSELVARVKRLQRYDFN